MNTDNRNHEPSNALYQALPAVAYLKRINFRAELPEDFVQLISIENQYGHLLNDSFMEQGRINWLGEYKTDQFSIKENKIYFSGNFSGWWIVRVFQKFEDWLTPAVYKMKYIDSEGWKSHCR